MSASGPSGPLVLSLRLYSSFITWRPGLIFFSHLYRMSQKSPRSRSEAKSQNGSIAEEIEEDIDDLSIEGDDLLRSEKSAVST